MTIQFNVEHFIRDAREAQKQGGTQMRGRAALSDSMRRSIKLVAIEVCTTDTRIPHEPEIIEDLLLRFEEMCRRNQLSVDLSQRSDVIHYLLAELNTNLTALSSKARQLVPLTAYVGAVLPGLLVEFAEFEKTPWVFRHVAKHRPTNPRAALQEIQKTIAEIKNEAEFAEFREIQRILLHVTVLNPTNPRAMLRRMQKTIAQLKDDAEFAEFAAMPWVFRNVALSNPANPRAALRKKQTLG